MRVIPVIDLKGGIVVHAIRGIREQYRPVESVIAHDAQPVTVANAFASLGFRTVYVADLDAIAGHSEDRSAYSAIREAGLRMWLDAGINSLDRIERLATFADRLMIGTESLSSVDVVQYAIANLGTERVVISFDMKSGEILTRNPRWRSKSAQEIAEELITAGISQLILLDLDRVGTQAGSRLTVLCADLIRSHADLNVYIGGGIRSLADMKDLKEAGCRGALISTSLHRGLITSDDLMRDEVK